MQKLLLLISLSLVVTSFGFEKSQFYTHKTQSIKVRFGDDEGVLMMKHYHYGRPVFIVSTFEETNVKKTKMVNKKSFYRLYQDFYEVVTNSAKLKKKSSRCKKRLDVTFKVQDQGDRLENYCMDKMELKHRRNFSNWYIQIKEKL